jgi:menaquinone-9 beta-reductase
MNPEVIVVGAGPGGSATAFHLARRGRRVLLLERETFPRDKSCGDGLTRAAVRLLAEIGVLPDLSGAPRIRGARILMRGRGSRDFLYPEQLGDPNHGLVVPRLKLDHAICRRAVAAGAKLWEGARVTRLINEAGAVVGVEIDHFGQQKQLRAPVVVAADGATSRLARQSGLVLKSTRRLGYAIRGYYDQIEELPELLEIYTPLLDPTDRYLLPSYGWIFPTGPTSANIGVGLFERAHGANVRELFERFLETLHRDDPRFRQARLCGQWLGAPLHFDFEPSRCMAAGLLLVGDAAGMISPFTGEGIGYAIEAGKLAAETIDGQLRPGATTTPDLSEYAERLGQAYTGYFEAGRHSARRYLLIWHVLESTFHNDRPLFDICRQAALFPEGIGESYVTALLEDISPLFEQQGFPLRADLFAIGEVLSNKVRRDWPFLTRLSAIQPDDPGIPFRPALLLLLAAYLGNPRREELMLVGAAVELGYLAMLAQTSVVEELDGQIVDGQRPANWGNMFALMIGDFLLSKAYEVSAQVGPQISHEIATALARACEGRVLELRNAHNLAQTEADHLMMLEHKTGTLFALPCRLGAMLSDVPISIVEALTGYGRELGIAFQLADDVRSITAQASKFGKITASDPREGMYGLAVLRALQGDTATEMRSLLSRMVEGDDVQAEVVALVRRSGATDSALELAHIHARRAQAALESLPNGPARQALNRLADYVVSHELGR